MADPVDLHQAVVARLREEAPMLTVYDGDVPTQPRSDNRGFALPYAAVWSGAGEPIGTALSGDAVTGLIQTFQVTCAGGDVTRCLHAARITRAALLGARFLASGPDAVVLDSSTQLDADWVLDATVLSGPIGEQPTGRVATKDPDTSPPRWFLPLIFRFTAH